MTAGTVASGKGKTKLPIGTFFVVNAPSSAVAAVAAVAAAATAAAGVVAAATCSAVVQGRKEMTSREEDEPSMLGLVVIPTEVT